MRIVKCLAATFALAAMPASAMAAPDYDPALEAAAIKLAVGRLGPLRGGFQGDQEPTFNRPAPQQAEAGAGEDPVWENGLAPATDLPTMTIKQP
jgi:hypothetical protein